MMAAKTMFTHCIDTSFPNLIINVLDDMIFLVSSLRNSYTEEKGNDLYCGIQNVCLEWLWLWFYNFVLEVVP